LANDSAIFDSATFDTIAEAIEWARNRGGNYRVSIGLGNFDYHSDTDSFHRYNGDEWETIPADRIADYV